MLILGSLFVLSCMPSYIHYQDCLSKCAQISDQAERTKCEIMCKQVYLLEKEQELSKFDYLRNQSQFNYNYWLIRQRHTREYN